LFDLLRRRQRRGDVELDLPNLQVGDLRLERVDLGLSLGYGGGRDRTGVLELGVQ
jgi:hypothetical protein